MKYKVWNMDKRRVGEMLLIREHDTLDEALQDAELTSQLLYSKRLTNDYSVFVFQGDPLYPMVIKHIAGWYFADMIPYDLITSEELRVMIDDIVKESSYRISNILSNSKMEINSTEKV